MSFERSYSIESHERIKRILIFGDKSLLLPWWVTNVYMTRSMKTIAPNIQTYISSYSSGSQPVVLGPLVVCLVVREQGLKFFRF